MGRTRTKSKKTVPKITESPTLDSGSPATSSSSNPPIAALLEKAQSLIIQCDYDLALLFVRRVLEKEPTHADGRETLGVVQLETGDLDGAKQTFLSLIPPNPNAANPPPPSAYLYLAQLSDGEPRLALQHYQSAIDLLMSQLKGKERAANSDKTEDEDELKANIVRALIGMVEIWMDPSYDLCFEPNADVECEKLLNVALQTDPGNSEALQALASVRMSQERPDDAKECLEKAWVAWKDLDIDDPKLPPIPTRLSLVKLFLELSLFTPALLVLHGVMSTDDQEVEAWYLEGWCFFLMSEHAQQPENGGTLDGMTWQELAKDSRDCLETCGTLHVNEDHPDKELLAHVKELVEKLEQLGIQASPVEEAEDGEGWEDLDESGEDEDEDEDGDVEMS